METDGYGVDDWLKSIGGVAFFVAGVLPWWTEGFDNGLSQMFNAFDYTVTGLLPYAIFLAIAILTIIIRTESLRLPLILIDPVLTLVGAAGGTVLVGIRFFMDGFDNDSFESSHSVTRGMGLYLAAASALVVLAGSVLAYRDRDELTGVEDVDDDLEREATYDLGSERVRGRRHAQHPPLP